MDNKILLIVKIVKMILEFNENYYLFETIFILVNNYSSIKRIIGIRTIFAE